MKLKKGDCFPNVKLFRLNDGSPEKISSADLFNKKNSIGWSSWCLYTNLY